MLPNWDGTSNPSEDSFKPTLASKMDLFGVILDQWMTVDSCIFLKLLPQPTTRLPTKLLFYVVLRSQLNGCKSDFDHVLA